MSLRQDVSFGKTLSSQNVLSASVTGKKIKNITFGAPTIRKKSTGLRFEMGKYEPMNSNGKNTSKIPNAFAQGYPEAKFQVISKANYLDIIE